MKYIQKYKAIEPKKFLNKKKIESLYAIKGFKNEFDFSLKIKAGK